MIVIRFILTTILMIILLALIGVFVLLMSIRLLSLSEAMNETSNLITRIHYNISEKLKEYGEENN